MGGQSQNHPNDSGLLWSSDQQRATAGRAVQRHIPCSQPVVCGSARIRLLWRRWIIAHSCARRACVCAQIQAETGGHGFTLTPYYQALFG